jgi:hypothetical protein
MKKYGSISHRHGFAEPDPDQTKNVMDPQHRFFGTNSEVSVRIRVFRIRNTSIWIADPDPVLFDSWIRIQDKHHR